MGRLAHRLSRPALHEPPAGLTAAFTRRVKPVDYLALVEGSRCARWAACSSSRAEAARRGFENQEQHMRLVADVVSKPLPEPLVVQAVEKILAREVRKQRRQIRTDVLGQGEQVSALGDTYGAKLASPRV